MDDMPLLRVIIGKTVIYGSIPSAFVSIAPKEDARMIDISGYRKHNRIHAVSQHLNGIRSFRSPIVITGIFSQIP